jgi:hypothetical protein
LKGERKKNTWNYMKQKWRKINFQVNEFFLAMELSVEGTEKIGQTRGREREGERERGRERKKK